MCRIVDNPENKDVPLAISVVIATYNGANFIQETLRSCLDQSEPPAEVIVVDDASTDETTKLVIQVVSPRVPVRLIRCRRNSGGPARPYNLGIAHTTSPIVALLDHDDAWHHDKLRYSLQAIQKLPKAGLVYADYQSFETAFPDQTSSFEAEATSPQLIPHADAVRSAFQRQFTLTMSNMVVRKDWWGQVGGFPESYRISTDYAFLARLLSARAPIVHIAAPLVFYRVSPTSVWLTSDYVRRNLERYLTVDFLCRRFPHPSRAAVSRKLGRDLYDLADQATRRGKVDNALLLYAWALRHQYPAHRVLKAIMIAMKGAIPNRFLDLPRGLVQTLSNLCAART